MVCVVGEDRVLQTSTSQGVKQFCVNASVVLKDPEEKRQQQQAKKKTAVVYLNMCSEDQVPHKTQCCLNQNTGVGEQDPASTFLLILTQDMFTDFRERGIDKEIKK